MGILDAPARTDAVGIDARKYGVVADGTTDNTTAINAAITAANSAATAFGTKVARILFPAGAILTRGGHTDGGGNICFSGMGEGRTYIQVKSGTTGGADVLSLNGRGSRVENLTIDGNRFNATIGDGIVLNNNYQSLAGLMVTSTGGNGITLGKTASAASHVLTNIRTRYCAAYGIQTVGTYVTYDGRWTDIDVGISGKSGVRLDKGTHHLNTVHSWGNGVYSDLDGTDSAGFYITSAGNKFSDCQADSNNSFGIYDNSLNTKWTGGQIWGNYLSGIYTGPSSTRFTISGASIERNNVSNTTGAGGSANAAIRNTSIGFTMSGCHIWDDTYGNPAISYPGFTPPFPYPGRADGIKTQAYAYAEPPGADYSCITGNAMRGSDTCTGIAYFLSGTHSVFADNQLGATGLSTPNVGSAATITIPSDARNGLCTVSGTTGITSITSCPPGTRVTLLFSGVLTVTNGGNLYLNSNLTTAVDTTLSLISNGSNWYELTRSTNR